MEEAVSGVKGELAIKIFGTDLKELKKKVTRSCVSWKEFEAYRI